MDKQLIFAYKHYGSAYINLTNKCSNDCEFCLRRSGVGINQDTLWLQREPENADEVISQLDKIDEYSEVVFCGFGESTYKLELMVELAKKVKADKKTTRLNTNGLGNLINGFDIVPSLSGCMDVVSISLNESTAKRYDDICHPQFGLKSFDSIVEFAGSCVKSGIKTILTVVDVIPASEIEKCKAIASKIGAELKVRKHIKNNKKYV